jgi:TonB-linked SusC/RagA family outer membrane protein
MPVGRRLFLSWLLLSFFLCSSAQKMSIEGKGMTIGDVLDTVHQKTGFLCDYFAGIFKDAPRVDLDLHHVDVHEVLDSCLAGLRFEYVLERRAITIRRKPGVGFFLPVMGRVQSSSGEALPGVTISVSGVSAQMSSMAGWFQVPMKGYHTLVEVSCLGYRPETLVLCNKKFQVITLEPLFAPLDHVVVQAYGMTTQRLTTGSVTEVPGPVIQSSPDEDVLGALEGRVPGMVIRQFNGVPGSTRQVLIRGQRSIEEGNRMLIVIDGVPLVDNDGYTTVIGSGSAQGALGAEVLNGIAPEDIASVEVLKDASATAIYGSRGANGVLLITLKSGSPGKLHWHAAVSGGVDAVIRPSRLMNTSQYLAMRREAVENDEMKVDSLDLPEAYLWDTTRSSDYQHYVMGHARWRKDANLGLSGGDSNTVYLLSGSYHQEEAVFPGGSPDERISLFGHVHEQSGNRRLQVDLSVIEHWENNRLPQIDYSVFQYLAPDAPGFFAAGGQPQWSYNGLSYLNLPATGYNSYRGSVQNEYSHLEIGYDLLPGLVLRSSLGYYRIGSVEHTVEPIIGQDPAFDPTGSTSVTNNSEHSEMIEEMADLKRKVGPGQLEALVGVNWQEQQSTYATTVASGYTSDLVMSTGGGDPTITETGNSIVYRYEAVFGRLNYNLSNRYIAEVSGRRDGSSRFGPGDQFGNFWATSGAWIFSEEPWAKNWAALSHGKLRASIGTTGNDQIGANYAQVYSGTSAAQGYQGSQGLIPTSLPNSDLRWEVNYNSEIAMDLGFLNNRILFSAAAYRDWTTNQLVQSALPSQTGQPSVFVNMPANVVKEGMEVTLRTVNWSSPDWSWTSTLTVSAPVNRLAAFRGLATTQEASTLVVGKSLSVVKGYQYQGVSVDSGLFQFRDMNHDGVLNDNDLVAGGNLDPRYYGGLDQVVRYKHWELDLFIEFRRQSGQNPFVILYQTYMPGFASPLMEGNAPVEYLDRWRQAGDHAVLQQMTESTSSVAYQRMQDYISSTANSMDASFIRLKNLALSYRLPREWLRRVSLKGGRLWLKGENLFTYTRFPVTDPETQDPQALPPVKTVAMGLQVNF